MTDKHDISLPVLSGLTRRTAIKGAGMMLGTAAFAKAIAPLWGFAGDIPLDEFMQKHYKELSDEDKKLVFQRLEQEAKDSYGINVSIKDPQPISGVRFAYAINLSACNGNGKCMEACHHENYHDRDTNQSYIRILEMPVGTNDMEQGNTTYTHAVPAKDKYYMPVQCFQCENPPCVFVGD